MSDSDTLPISTDVPVSNDDASIIFSQTPPWYQYTDPQGKKYMVTQTYLSQFTYTFIGSKIWYYSDMNHDHGPFSASIDGVMYGTWTSAWPTHRPSVVLFHASVQPGQHTLTVTNLSANYTSLEHLVYRPLTNDSATRNSNTSSASDIAPDGANNSVLGPSNTSNSTSLTTESRDTGLPSSSPASKHSNTVAYIGIALGAVCFLLLGAVVTLVYILHRKRSRRSNNGVLLPPSIDSEHDINGSQGLHPFPVSLPTNAPSSSDTSYVQSRKLDILTLDVHKEASSRAATVTLE